MKARAEGPCTCPTPVGRRSALRILFFACLLLPGCQVIRLPGGYTVNFPGSKGEPLPQSQLQQRLRLPRGFSIATYAGGIDNVRLLLFTARGDLLASAPRQGKIFLIQRGSAAPVAQSVRVVLDQLNSPHGLALHDGWLYVAETNAVARVRFDADSGQTSGALQRIVADLPGGGRHWSRTIHFGPDGWLYVSVGSSCNACIDESPRRAALLRYRPDGSDQQVYASGLRNAVDFAWRPASGELYATDNGRDLLGDDFPPCELNRVVAGGFYGWPYANGNRVPDPDFGAGNEARIATSIAPAHSFAPHTAPLGIAFYDAGQFPPRYRGAAFVALHGSWNRAVKSGYKVVALHFDDAGAIREEDFLSGFELDDKVYGRPVGVAVGPDGALYVSDDFTGSIYRIAYGEAPVTATGASAALPAQMPAGDPLAELAAVDKTAATQRGAELWARSGCSGCHTPQAPAASYRPLPALAAKYDIDSLTTYLRVPQPPMPAFPFSDAQRRDLAVYLLATHPRQP